MAEIQTQAPLSDDPYPVRFLKKHGEELSQSYGYINHDGEVILPLQYDRTYQFSEGLGRVKVFNKFGFVDKNGTWAIKPMFDYADDFKEGLAVGCVNGKCGYINDEAQYIIEPRFTYARSFSEGLAAVDISTQLSKHLYGYINRDGEFVIKPEFNNAWDFSDGAAKVEVLEKKVLKGIMYPEGKSGFIDHEGRWLTPIKFDDFTSSFFEGLAVSKLGDFDDHQWGFIDKAGEFKIQPQYALTHDFSEGVAAAAVQDRNGVKKYGFIDHDGNVVIDFEFSYAREFHEGLAQVRPFENGRSGKLRYINRDGDVVIMKSGTPFENGLAFVMEDSEYGVINKEGDYIWKHQYGEDRPRPGPTSTMTFKPTQHIKDADEKITCEKKSAQMISHYLHRQYRGFSEMLSECGDYPLVKRTAERILVAAAKDDQPDFIRAIVKQGISIDALAPEIISLGENYGYQVTALHNAVTGGRLEIVQYLVESGADVNALNSTGVTPLMSSVIANQYPIFVYLLNKGGDPRMRTQTFKKNVWDLVNDPLIHDPRFKQKLEEK